MPTFKQYEGRATHFGYKKLDGQPGLDTVVEPGE